METTTTARRRATARGGTTRRSRAAAVLLGTLLVAGAAVPASGTTYPAGTGPAALDPAASGTTASTVAEDADGTTYRLPVKGSVVTLFRPPPQPWAAGHRGVDLRADVGAEVGAPAPGVVTYAGTVVDRGVLTIAHPDGLRSSLEPVTALVEPGTAVLAGQPVAVVEDRGSHCSPTCLHWGVRDGSDYVDPLSLLPGAGLVVLLPGGTA